MTARGINYGATFIFHVATDVMYLHTQEMTKTVWEERRRDARFEQGVGISLGQIGVDKNPCKHPVSLDMQFAIVDANPDAANDVTLHAVHTIDQVLEALISE